jgi:hypothetical protein
MRPIVFLLCGMFLAAALLAPGADLSGVKTVYLLPMRGNMDQFLANRLTEGKVLQVVTDPQKADAVFTEQLGEALELRLNELYPATDLHKPSTAKGEQAGTATAEEQTRDKSDDQKPVRFAASGRGGGTLFLVDAKTRSVLWSTYEKPKGFSGDYLDKAAEHIVSRLKRDLKAQ